MSWFFIITLFLFFLLRLPSLFEPLWYGDEGIYQAIGMALNNGSLLYKDIWDNKTPLLYLVYALFHSDQFTVRLVSLIFGLLSIPVFFFLSKKLFYNLSGSRKIHYFTTPVFALLFALPILEGNIANAENFMLLPILLAALLIFPRTETNFKLLLAGFLLGLAFLFKVVAIFDLSAFLIFLFFLEFPTNRKLQDKKYIILKFKQLSPFLIGFFVPIGATVLFFLLNNAFVEFVRAIFFSNVGYVGYGNKLLTPFGLLFIKLALLLGFVVFLFMKRLNLKPTTIFVLLWFAFSLFNAFFAERPYTHYLLTLLPSFVLMIGLIFWDKKYQKIKLIFLFLVLVLILKNFNFYGKTTNYYQNFTSFILGQKSVYSYRAFFDKRTSTDYEIAMFIKSKIEEGDSIFVWGNNAQLYKMTESIPLTKYIVAYHITGYKDGLANTRELIERTKPKFIIIMSGQAPIPFGLTRYTESFNINNVSIYEIF